LSKSYQHDENAEIKYLKDLIETFGTQFDLRPDEATQEIGVRFRDLEKKQEKILQTLDQSVDGYYQLCRKVHAILYRDIICNAGQFRNSSDPNGGNVYFGGNDLRTMKAKFTGTRPDLIELELSEAFTILVDNKYSPQETSLRFYAEFVAIHPFYDANGRIGRYIVDIYLRQYQRYVDWQSVKDSHKKFMRKLNYCHSVRTKYKQHLYQYNLSSTSYSKVKAYWEAVREKYIVYLVNFWEQFIKSNDNLEDIGEIL